MSWLTESIAKCKVGEIFNLHMENWEGKARLTGTGEEE